MATLKYGVNFLNYLSQQLADLDGITTLAHELTQNADDAKNDAGELAATRITFNITDDALLVSNDAVFREEDFDRLREVASASKRSEAGARTTGAFGVGFISVYQITDRPEIRSAGRHWTLRPEDQEIDVGRSNNDGTVFRLPWAFEESSVRKGLRKPSVDKDSIDSFVEELKESLPRTILFLKKLDTIRLLRNGNSVIRIKRVISRNTTKIDCDSVIQTWHFVEGGFGSKASRLKEEYSPDYIEDNRSDRVRVAIPDSLYGDSLLFATLPTKQSTGLPFHIDADFFPNTNRKSIVFEGRGPRSEWNRAAMCAAAAAVADNLIPLRDMFRDEAPTFWGILDRLQHIHREHGDNAPIPLGAFWKRLSLPNSPIVYTESGKWTTPDQVYIPTGDKEKGAVPAFDALDIEVVHLDLLQYRNILTSIGVSVLRIEHIHRELRNMRLVGHIWSDNPLPDSTLELLWKGIHGILENTQGRTNRVEADRLLKQCTLAPGMDGRLWPCGLVYRADKRTRKLFAPLMSRNVASFLAVQDIPLLQKLCPQFTLDSAIKELERPEAQWHNGSFDPAALLRWFDDHKRELIQGLRERLAQLPIFPSAERGRLCSLNDLWLPGGFDDPVGVADLLDTEKLDVLTDFLRFLGAGELTFRDYVREYIPDAFARDHAVSREVRRKLLDILAERTSSIRDDQEVKGQLCRVHIIECTDGEFRQPRDVYFSNQEVKDILGDHVNYALLSGKSESRADLYRWLGVHDQPRTEKILQVIDKLMASIQHYEARKEVARILDAVGKAWITLGNDNLGGELAKRRIVECADGEFRQPRDVYFPNKDVKAILGDHVNYALQPSAGRANLYRKLGVKSRPRAEDILCAIGELASRQPVQKPRKEMVKILEILGKRWAGLLSNEKERYRSLKSKVWLPAEKDSTRWYSPNELYAAYNKSLFASQAQFLDLPVGVQQAINEFLGYLGVNPSPQLSQVVSHLLRCSELNQMPPGGIYRWLNGRAETSDLWRLRDTACLYITNDGGRYVRPGQVFRGKHSFGRFRFGLGDDFRQYPKLLSALDIKESPDHNDAIQVLKDISKEIGSNTLSSEYKDRDAVLQCWVMLSEALEREEITEERIEMEFHNIRCIPNNQEVLEKPSLIFFEDSSVPLDKFMRDLFSNNLIDRLDRVHQAMKSAGVRSISDVVWGIVDERVNPQEDEGLKEIVKKRARLIEHVSNDAINLENIDFIRTEELKVRWHTDTFRNYSTSPEPISAHLDKDTLYFILDGNSRPWPAIARELTKAITHGEEIVSIAPAIMIILQTATDRDAVSQLEDLGIDLPKELGELESTGAVAKSLDEASPSDSDQEPLTSPQDEPTSGDVDEQPEPEERGNDSIWSDDQTEPGESRLPGTYSGGTGDGSAETTGNGSVPIQRKRPSKDDGGTSRVRQPRRTPRGKGRAQFHSYVEVRPDEEEQDPERPDPDGLEHDARVALEEEALDFILKCEPEWEPTPTHNPGYDLYQADQHGNVIRWCEVKAMRGTWQDRPVGLTHTQFKTAQKCGEDYWLYVVEHAGTGNRNIVKIQDPAGQARTFAFDHGWRKVAK